MLPRYDAAFLRRLSLKMQGDAKRFSARLPAKSAPNAFTCHLSADALVLHIPPPLTSELTAAGVNPSLASRISSAMTTALLRLKSDCEADFRRKLPLFREQLQRIPDPKFATAITFTYMTIFDAAIRNHTFYLLQEVAPRVVKAQMLRQQIICSPSSDGALTPKRPFNPSAIPILERYFEDNAFPTRLEKFELASKCDMAYKQIHVWFQNRRSRHRKEGKQLRRRDGGNSVFDELEKFVMDALLPVAQEDEQTEPQQPQVDSLQNIATAAHRNHFHLDPPAHAFPSPYPAICSYDPFPIEPERRAFGTKWSRSPSRQCFAAGGTFDVSELALAFSKMSLASDSTSTNHPSAPPPDRNPLPTLSYPAVGFLTPCSRAPHPALITRPNQVPLLATVNCFRLLPYTCRPSRPVASWDPLAEPKEHSTNNLGLPISSSSSCALVPRRSRRTIPRRVPRNPPVNAEKIAPPRSPASWITTKSCSTSSVSSNCSTSGSDTESLLDTPPLLPVDLPHALLPFPPEKGIPRAQPCFQSPVINAVDCTDFSDQDVEPSARFETNLFPSFTSSPSSPQFCLP